MNEAYARTTWCPMVIMSADDGPKPKYIYNRKSHEGDRCLGSGCGVWVQDGLQDGHCGFIGNPINIRLDRMELKSP
jgi:hypothetical protein